MAKDYRYATPSVNKVLYDKLLAWVNERQAKALPTYTAPSIINKLMIEFLMRVTDDPEVAAMKKSMKTIEHALDTTAAKFVDHNGP